MKFDSKAFLTAFEPQFPRLTQSARQGLSFLIEQINKDSFDMLEHVAYALATAYWESGRTFQPVKEKRASSSRQPGLYANQNRYWPSGAYGRGLVQITWPENYCKFGMCSRDDYEKALEPQKAYEIMSRGMKEGLFARDKKGKHSLARHIKPGSVNYREARRIINGTDKADVVAGFAVAIEKALRVSLITEKVEDSPAPQGDGFVKDSATPTDTQPKEDTLDSLPNVSKSTLARGGGVAAGVARNIWARVLTAVAGGEYLKLSYYIVAAIVVGVVIYHYRSKIWGFIKKAKSKVTE